MRLGIVAPATPAVIAQCETAEALGFEATWLFDSHMVYSDVYVIMALCAERTRKMSLGTGIAVAPSRIAPVTAHSIATLNQLYPGRVALGHGEHRSADHGLPADEGPRLSGLRQHREGVAARRDGRVPRR